MRGDWPERKHPRLKGYDYGQNGCYFATICVKNRVPLLGEVRGGNALLPPKVELSEMGNIADQYMQSIKAAYENVTVENYVIMPNHIHLLISIHEPEEPGGRVRASRPTLHTVIRSFKTMVTRQIGFSIWQDSYYDRIIRSERGRAEAWRYIDENPAKWKEDELFIHPQGRSPCDRKSASRRAGSPCDRKRMP